jgi:hypothetical protein
MTSGIGDNPLRPHLLRGGRGCERSERVRWVPGKYSFGAIERHRTLPALRAGSLPLPASRGEGKKRLFPRGGA